MIRPMARTVPSQGMNIVASPRARENSAFEKMPPAGPVATLRWADSAARNGFEQSRFMVVAQHYVRATRFLERKCCINRMRIVFPLKW
jgi:hypothetical protein